MPFRVNYRLIAAQGLINQIENLLRYHLKRFNLVEPMVVREVSP